MSLSLTGATILTYATRLSTVVLGLLTSVLVAQALGPEGRGQVALAGALGSTLVQFGLLGLHSANVYHVSRTPSWLAALYANSVAMGITVGGSLVLVMATIFSIWPALAPVHGLLLAASLLWVPCNLLSLLLLNLLLGVHDMRGYNGTELLTRTATCVLSGVLIWFGAATPLRAFLAGFVALIAGLALTIARLHQRLDATPRLSVPVLRSSLAYGLRAYVACLCGFLVMRLDLLIVGQTLGAQEAGYYSLATTLGDHVLLLPITLASTLYPRLSADLDPVSRFRTAARATGVIAALLAALTMGTVAICPWLIRTLYGSAFLPAVDAWRWLAPGIFFMGVQTVLGQYLSASGFPRGLMVAWVIGAILNVAATAWAVPRFGIIGASAASTATYFLLFILVGSEALRHRRTAQA